MYLKNTLTTYISAWIIRLFIALVFINNNHKPDEVFQGPEVAHNLAFGNGYLTWQWTFYDPIRNPTFPMLYAIPYYVLSLFGIDQTFKIFPLIPKLVQVFIGATYDTMLIKINNHFNPKTTGLLLFLNFTNWSSVMYLSRTYVNGIETVITMIAFYLWLKRSQNQNYDMISRCLAIFNFAMRGTSVLFWVVVWPYELLTRHFDSVKNAATFILKNLLTIVLMCTLSISFSYLYYRKLVFVEYNFFYYNAILGWSSICGDSPSHFFFTYYLLKGFQAYTILIYFGAYVILTSKDKSLESKKELVWIVILQMILLSTSRHKQLRFLLIQYPYLIVILIHGYNSYPFPNKKKLIILGSTLFSIFYFCLINLVIKYQTPKLLDYIKDHHEIKKLMIITSPYEMPLHSHTHRKDLQIMVPYCGFDIGSQSIEEGPYSFEYPQQYFETTIQRRGLPTHVVTLEYKLAKKHFDINATQHKFKQIMKVWAPHFQNMNDRYLHLYQLTN